MPSTVTADRVAGLALGAVGVLAFSMSLPMTRIAVQQLDPGSSPSAGRSARPCWPWPTSGSPARPAPAATSGGGWPSSPSASWSASRCSRRWR
ncbi:hypothetical protein ACFQZ4_35535 [Catellatospora coxensis]